MNNYKQYNSTIKSIQTAYKQASKEHHLSRKDLRTLKYTIDNLISLYNTRAIPLLVLTNTEADKQPY